MFSYYWAILAPTILLLSNLAFCDGKTYWVDGSCTSRPRWVRDGKQVYMDDAFSMATRASERLRSPTDTDFLALYMRLFGQDNNGNVGMVAGPSPSKIVLLLSVTNAVS